MSSSNSEYSSPTGSATSDDHYGNVVLEQLEKVKSLINQEVLYNTRRVTRAVARDSSVVQQRVTFFENKSLKDLTRASADFLHNIPLYQPGPSKGKHTVSAPVTPALSDSSESLVSTRSMDPNMALGQDHQQGTQEPGFPGFPEQPSQWTLFVGRAAVSTEFMEKQVAEITRKLQDATPPSNMAKKIMLQETKDYLNEIKQFMDEYHEIAMHEKVDFENMKATHTSLITLKNDFTGIRLVLEEDLPSTQPQQPLQQPDMNTHLANMVSTVQNIANGPHVQLPYFSGKVTSYAGFKKTV